MASQFTETKTIDGKDYQFQLLSLGDAINVTNKIGGVVAGLMGKGERDDDLIYAIGKKVCAGLTIDDFEVKDLDAEFRGKVLLFAKVLGAGIQANFPDFFSELKSKDSAIGEILKTSGLGIEL